MTKLDREVARATGEDVREIIRRGFSPLTFGPVEREAEDLILDWDEMPLLAQTEQARWQFHLLLLAQASQPDDLILLRVAGTDMVRAGNHGFSHFGFAN